MESSQPPCQLRTRRKDNTIRLPTARNELDPANATGASRGIWWLAVICHGSAGLAIVSNVVATLASCSAGGIATMPARATVSNVVATLARAWVQREVQLQSHGLATVATTRVSSDRALARCDISDQTRFQSQVWLSERWLSWKGFGMSC